MTSKMTTSRRIELRVQIRAHLRRKPWRRDRSQTDHHPLAAAQAATITTQNDQRESPDRRIRPCWLVRQPQSRCQPRRSRETRIRQGGSQGFKSPHLHPALLTSGNVGRQGSRLRVSVHRGGSALHRHRRAMSALLSSDEFRVGVARNARRPSDTCPLVAGRAGRGTGSEPLATGGPLPGAYW